MSLIDTHAHLDDSRFDTDLDAVVTRAVEAGLERIISVGISAETSRQAVQIAERFGAIVAAVGIQPNSCAEASPGDWDEVVQLVDHEKVVAIGETGLDRYWDYTPFAMQEDYFDRHLRLAQERDMPILIHCRECDEDVLRMLREAIQRGPVRGLIHAFSGSAAMAEECVEMGLFLSFAGPVTYRNKKFDPLREVAARVPADRLLVETDSPYLVPHPLRGKVKRNEPAKVALTAAALAELRGCSAEELARQTTENARKLFGLPG